MLENSFPPADAGTDESAVGTAPAVDRGVLPWLVAVSLTLVFQAGVIIAGTRSASFENYLLCNGTAFLLFASAGLGLYLTFRMLTRSPWLEKSAPNLPSLGRKPLIVAAVLAAVCFVVCLPPSLRSIENSRVLLPYQLDDAITMDQISRFLRSDYWVPEYRYQQGWVLFLPVTVFCKVLNYVVPVDPTTAVWILNFVQLLILSALVASTFLLFFRISASYWFSVSGVLITYSRPDFFSQALACTRLDNLGLLAVVLCLHALYTFVKDRTARSWFFAIFFSALAFSAKYSGHLLLPTLVVAWILHWNRNDVKGSFSRTSSFIATGLFVFAASVSAVFALTFALFNPYHYINFTAFRTIILGHVFMYSSGNFWDLPGYEAPSHLAVWWKALTTPYPVDLLLTLLFMFGLAATLIQRIFTRDKASGQYHLLFASWILTYLSFVVYAYGSSSYHYLFPIAPLIAFYAMFPFVSLQASLSSRISGTFIARLGPSVLGLSLMLLSLSIALPHVRDSLEVLATARYQDGPHYEVGRYLDRRIPWDEDPPIVNTLFAYVPPRFTHHEYQSNVNLTHALLRTLAPRYVIIHDIFYQVYANKTLAGRENHVNRINGTSYAEVVRFYSDFKNRTYPGYRFLVRFGPFEIFESDTRETLQEVAWDWLNGTWKAVVPRAVVRTDVQGQRVVLHTNGESVHYQAMTSILVQPETSYVVKGRLTFREGESIRVGILTKDQSRFLALTKVTCRRTVPPPLVLQFLDSLSPQASLTDRTASFELPFGSGGDNEVIFLLSNDGSPRQRVVIDQLSLYEKVTVPVESDAKARRTGLQ